MPEKNNVMLIKEFFGYGPNGTLKSFSAELQALTDADKVQLGEGIRDGSLTY